MLQNVSASWKPPSSFPRFLPRPDAEAASPCRSVRGRRNARRARLAPVPSGATYRFSAQTQVEVSRLSLSSSTASDRRSVPDKAPIEDRHDVHLVELERIGDHVVQTEPPQAVAVGGLLDVAQYVVLGQTPEILGGGGRVAFGPKEARLQQPPRQRSGEEGIFQAELVLPARTEDDDISLLRATRQR